MSDLVKPGAVLFAKDLPRVAQFYENLLGMEVSHAQEGLIVLDAPAHQLVIHGIPPDIAQSIVITSPPQRRSNTAVKLVFPVGSLADARHKALALGGELDPAHAEFALRGCRACDGHDPEGNVIQFRENAAP